MGKHAVNFNASRMRFGLAVFYNGFFANPFNKVVSHIGQCGFPVRAGLGLHLRNYMLQHILFVVGEAQRVHHRLIALDELCSGESWRHVYPVGMILHKMSHRMYGSVNRSRAKVLNRRLLSCLRHMYGRFYKLVNAFVFDSRQRHYRNAEILRHLVDLYGVAVHPHFVHHIQGDNHRYIQLHKL